jgi:DNA-binding GntR family transcriptional regulator
MGNLSFQLQKPDLLAVPIATLLREAIFEGVLRPGDRLVERQLASQWNVSRAPLREAIEQLTAEGLLVRSPHRGASVRELSERELNELFAVREMLEVNAMRIAVSVLADEDLVRLQDLVDRAKMDVKTKNLRDFRVAGLAFHDELVRLSKNTTLIEIYDGVKLKFRRYQLLLASLPDLPKSSALEHENILTALRDRDADLAGKLLAEHLAHLVRRFAENGRDYFNQNGRPSTIDQR